MKAGNTEELLKVFGVIIQNLRLDKNLSQAELAERGDFNRTYISDLERGKKQASLSTILRLADALEIDPSELMEYLEDKIQM